MQKSFERLENVFCESVILHFPDPRKEYYLETDASNYALGAVLYQKSDKGEKEIITLASRTLQGPELAYFTTEKELLAIVWVLQKFRTYLQGARIINRTDHMALTFLKTCKFVNARLTRWILTIQDYNIEVEHCLGRENVVADMLSRLHPEKDWEKEKDYSTVTINELKYVGSKRLKNYLQNIPQAQMEDERVQIIKRKVAREEEETTRYKIQDGILYQKARDVKKIYLHRKAIEMLIWEGHKAYGHIGADKSYKISEHFYYPRLAKIIRQTLRSCDSCQRNKIPTIATQVTFESVQPELPLELISIDSASKEE